MQAPQPSIPSDEIDAERQVEDLVRRHQHVAVLAAHDILGDWSLAEDAAQLAFLFILKRLRSGDRELLGGNAEATVRRNARWAAMDMRRRRTHNASAEHLYGESAGALDDGMWSSLEARMICESVLRSLPDHYRQAIHLRFVRGLPDAAAATMLDVTLASYRRRLDRALAVARMAVGRAGVPGAAAVLVAAGLRALLRRGRDQAAALWRHVDDTGRQVAEIAAAWATPVATTTALLVIAGGGADAALPVAVGTGRGPALVSVVSGDTVRIAEAMRAGVGAGVPAVTPVPAKATPTLAARPAGAAAETPDDSDIYTVAATPGSDGHSSVVAMGWGHTCQCAVLFESRDGAATWRAAAGPGVAQYSIGGLRVALPPAYPADPRIFLGTLWAGAMTDLVEPAFGEPFTALPATGYITVPPSFERDGTLLLSGPLGLSVLWLHSGSAQPVLFQPPLAGTGAVAAPLSGGTDAFVLAASAPDVARAAGSPITTSAASATPTTLYRCARGGGCTGLSQPPLASAGGIAVSPHFSDDATLAVFWDHTVLISHDGGETFALLPDPGVTVASLSMESLAGSVAIWAVGASSSGRGLLHYTPAAGWTWATPPTTDASQAVVTSPLVVGPGRVMVLSGTHLHCGAVAATSWSEACGQA